MDLESLECSSPELPAGKYFFLENTLLTKTLVTNTHLRNTLLTNTHLTNTLSKNTHLRNTLLKNKIHFREIHLHEAIAVELEVIF